MQDNPNAIDVLLVEDNLNDAELAMRELRKHRLANQLFHVEDGEAALDFLFATGPFADRRDSAFQPRIVLMDIQMPKLNGIDVLRRMKSDDRTRRIPVVILTSSNQDPDINTCYALGANSYIVKPVDFNRFSEAIKDLGFYWLLLNQPPR
ncbi:MAG: response regulator [Bacteroidetes bacterium]|nr:response regulator [Bacteroidota bacterium]